MAVQSLITDRESRIGESRIGESVKGIYTERAVVPPYRWLDSVPPPAPSIYVNGQRVSAASPDSRWWLIRAHVPAHWTWTGRRQSEWVTSLVRSIEPVRFKASPDRVRLQSFDAAGNPSPVAEWRRQP